MGEAVEGAGEEGTVAEDLEGGRGVRFWGWLRVGRGKGEERCECGRKRGLTFTPEEAIVGRWDGEADGG